MATIDPLVQAANLAANKNIEAGQANSPWSLPSQSPSPVILQPSQAQGGTTLNLAQPSNDTTQADATIAGAGQTSKTIQDYIKEQTAPTTQLSTEQLALTNRLSELYGQDTGKAQATASLEQSTGLVDNRKALADLNNQILTSSAQYDKAYSNAEIGHGQLTADVTGQQGAIRRSQAADIGLLQARALGMQGQVDASQKAVERAINLKYQSIEEEITAKEKQLQAIQPLLSQEQKTIADAQARMFADQKQALEEKKAKQKENLNTALLAGVNTKFVNRNGEFFQTSDGTPITDPQQFFKLAGVKSFEEAYQKGLVTDLSNTKLQDVQFAQQAQAKYPDVHIPVDATPEQVQQIIQGSRIYRKETYIAPPAGSGIGGSIVTQGSAPIVSPTLDAAVADIIRNNPNEWGKAADQIDAQFGAGTSTKYDSFLKAVYEQGQNIDQVYQPQQIGNLRSIDLSRLSTASNRIVQNYVKSPTYSAVASAAPFIQRLEAAKANPGSISDADLLDTLIKINTGGGQITEAQAKLITEGRSLSDTFNVFKKKTQNGGVLSDSQRNQAFELATQVFKNYQDAYTPVYKQATAQLQQANIPQSLWTIPDWNTLIGQNPSTENQTQGGFSVIAPDGNSYSFTSQQALDQFKKSAGIK